MSETGAKLSCPTARVPALAWMGLKHVRKAVAPLRRGQEALRQILEKIPVIEIESIENEAAPGDWQPDLTARLLVDGKRHLLISAYESNGQPRYARPALLELRSFIAELALEATPVFVAPYVSPAVRKLCEGMDAGFLDLVGNCRITFNGVFIERTVADRPATERRKLRSLFRPKSAQVLRTPLREPGRAWRVIELAEDSGVSVGQVSNVRRGLIDREWASVSSDGLILSDPDTLLDTWRESYVAPNGKRFTFYTPLHGRALEDAARSGLSAESETGRAIFASFSAARWIAPYGRTGTHYFFADSAGLLKLQNALNLQPVSKGGNVIITVPEDQTLFANTVEPAPGAVCTNPVQTYLDLSIVGERGAEAADHLRLDVLSWPR